MTATGSLSTHNHVVLRFARPQDQHTTMVSALEAAVEAQAGKEATLLQQLRTEMREAAAKAAQVTARGLCPAHAHPAAGVFLTHRRAPPLTHLLRRRSSPRRPLWSGL
jgi:hypothetical protein